MIVGGPRRLAGEAAQGGEEEGRGSRQHLWHPRGGRNKAGESPAITRPLWETKGEIATASAARGCGKGVQPQLFPPWLVG